MNTGNSSVIWTVIITAVILLIGGVFVYTAIPTNDEIKGAAIDAANTAIANAKIPTAADIASLIEVPQAPAVPTAEEITDAMPDTYYSIQDDKKELAEKLTNDELSDKDFKEWLADKISIAVPTDLEDNDIENIVVSDIDVDLLGWAQESANVDITAKVTVDDDGDEELVKVKFSMDVDELVRDDDYEDAEVDEDSFSDFELVRCYNDYC